MALRVSLHLSPLERVFKAGGGGACRAGGGGACCNLSTREPEAGGCEFEASLGYTVRHDLIKLTKKEGGFLFLRIRVMPYYEIKTLRVT